MSALKKVLPWLLQTHCCLFFEKDPDTPYVLQCLRNIDSLQDQTFSPWSPSQKFNEGRRLPPTRNMKGLSGSRSQHQIPLPHGLDYDPHVHDLHAHHGSDSRHPSYLLSPTESCPVDFHHRYSPRSSIHSDCMMMSPVLMPPAAASDHISSSTFPRMHYSSQYYDSATREDCAAITASATSPAVAAAAAAAAASSHHAGTKSNRLPANLLDQFEKQLPLHRDGFHTLQYQRTSTTTEQRSESPGRIRHLVHSVQKLFTKSHSLEGSSKMNGTKGDIVGGGGGTGGYYHHGHHSTKHGSKRSKSKERKHRSGGWWSSDDNLDSDSTYRTPSVMSRHHGEHVGHCYPDSMHSHHFGDLSLKASKSNNDVKCSACESMAMAPEGKFMKRSSWSTLTVSQAKEAYRKSSLNLDKPMMHTDLKPSSRTCHYLQVPQDEWSGYPGEKDEEIPCRRMRSSSYVKAMGEVDDESGDSDTSPKTSPQKAIRPDALVLKSAMHRPHLDSQSHGYHLQTTRDMRPHPSVTLDPASTFHPPPFRSRNQSYMRAVSTLSQASCVSQVSETEINGQFESVCESVFSEVESQAMEALDLPGSFRTRSHSYLRAIQAGYSQDDDCLPSMTSSTVTSTLRSTTEGYDIVDGTSLLNDDMVEDDDGASSSAYAELERLERETAAARSQHSTSSTVTAISVPPASPPSYRVPAASPIATSEPPVPQAIQAFKESANMVAAFNMQWKDEISAMRYELAELRRDVCGELKTFNSNFFNFTQCYNMWTLCREPCSDSTTQTEDRVSIGIQAGSSWSVRQNTQDKSVMCQPEPAPFSIMDLMDPPRIEIIEGTPESTPEGSGSPASPLPIEDFPWEINKKQKAHKQPDTAGHTGARSLAGGRREYGIQFRLPTSCSVDRAQPPPVVSYPPSYKKTPPPVPPRTTTKPLISVTAQSSTESTQDAYQEGRHPRGGLWTTDSLGRPIYSSTDSLDSTKAVTMAMESAAAKRHASLTSVQTCDKAVLVSKAEEYLKTPRSSIGIQVEAVTDSETDSKGLPQFHSIGIQVEDKKRHGRFKRSNSVTTAVQADMELERFPSMEDKGLQFGGAFGRHSEPSTPTQYGAIRTVRTQGLFSYREDYRPSSRPTSPQPEPWLVEPSLESTETGRVSPLRRDGSWFMQLLHNETKRLEGWCKEMEREAEEHDLSEEILGKIRSAVGSAQLLMSQKFQQFYWLCQQNLDPSAMPRPTSQDLAGFWDLLQLSIDDVTAKFDELQQIKSNQWQLVESPEKKERKWPPPHLPKRPAKGRGGVTRERSLDLQDRQRQEARRRLMAAKRAASFRQNSATERADSIEIYIPEAQTRL
ncbi:hypothetical protein Q5P01_004780 [Channa striata]|uniref:Disks large-associated protein 2 n=1 Tax=Channa striata TaxID=64152 RepID=A0AA88T0P2_CHASR|nr:hypothetical protein Q5P01_004780 [Channa striata]